MSVSSSDSNHDIFKANDGGESYVNQATKDLIEGKPAKESVILFQVLTVTQDGCLVSGDLLDNHYPSCLESVLQSTPSAHTAFPIRIEENLLLEDPSLFDKVKSGEVSPCLRLALLQQTAVLLHNLGIACLCHSKATTVTVASHSLQQMALHFSSDACSCLMRENLSLLKRDEEQGQQGLEGRSRSTPCLLIALINSLIHILHESALYAKARQFYTVLTQFRSVALDVEREDRALSGSPCAAAAA